MRVLGTMAAVKGPNAGSPVATAASRGSRPAATNGTRSSAAQLTGVDGIARTLPRCDRFHPRHLP